MKRLIFFVFFLLALPLAQAETLNADVGYINIPQLPPGGGQVNPIRYAAIEQAATSLGARGGLAWEARNLDLALSDDAPFLDQVFDFNQLLLNHDVLPPVLVESNDNLSLDDNDTLRIATKSYRIIHSARFVTAPPNWRDYLWMRFQQPVLSDRSLLPQTQAEAMVWNHFLKNGWENGAKQAVAIFTDNLNQMEQDMIGMILYRKLLAEHMVSAPFVATAELGVTGDASQLRINDQVLRITAQSEMQTNPKKWLPVITK
ncbi:MAG: type IV secretion system protein DotC [Gammaproteobacteria bacterium RIFCSPLOWO2_02_FULL_42_14]|nr:MAG: type IV secretion system protein DotC [Gammaproteobacteria bacterium RIFCSPHIGHO2_02_FULL_42_43]OGT53394.1 MAG: type IV secretion system protein DotC [Gammaproteobacteria bacterium RIFCSPHIGHO2_12_FULL_41_25]OGT63410.1 MAG: type IV secretion system protein DotC [Gammaproteobacteria bacterium RIFCSPLOWO2_02_FULL_42_14]OGT87336.1 MAG: type IV secretion system protein DotC [Gammaproteobacteria bacterium RIFCSPLOWO2_12_FULL_42_18]